MAQDTNRGDGLSRRQMLQRAAIAAGAGAAVWTAPHIETLGVAPAGAIAASQVIITSDFTDQDFSQNSGTTYCPASGPFDCCGSSWGDAGKFDEFTFTNPISGCTSLTVRIVPLDCNTTEKNPDIARAGVVFTAHSGTCNCTILNAIVRKNGGATVVIPNVNNGPLVCGSYSAGGAPNGTGINIGLDCGSASWDNGTKLGVVISCTNA
jgi:hypothetical protein